MVDSPLVVLPALFGGQAESWAALVELAPAFGNNWLLVGGQMVFLHEVERGALDVRPTDDVDVVVDLRAEPAGLERIHGVLESAGFDQDSPSPEGTAQVGFRAHDSSAGDKSGVPSKRLTIGGGRGSEGSNSAAGCRWGASRQGSRCGEDLIAIFSKSSEASA